MSVTSSPVYEYNLDIAYPDGYDQIAYTIKGQSLDKTVTIDPLWQQYRIDMTVTYTGGNGEGYDVDGKTSHTYTFYFDKLTSGVASLPESMAHVVATAGSVRISNFSGVAEVFTVDGRLVARSEIDGNGKERETDEHCREGFELTVTVLILFVFATRRDADKDEHDDVGNEVGD